MRSEESQNQVALFDLLRLNEKRLPQLSMVRAIPNGGLRNKIIAARLKREGVRAGTPDIAIFLPRGTTPGAFIEMKNGRNTLTETQTAFKTFAEAQGYKFAICYSWQAAQAFIEEYLGVKLTRA